MFDFICRWFKRHWWEKYNEDEAQFRQCVVCDLLQWRFGGTKDWMDL